MIRAWSSAAHKRVTGCSFCRAQRHSCEVKHIHYIRIAHFILKRKSYKIKIFHRNITFHRKQGYSLFSHLLLHIVPRSKHTLTNGILTLIQHMIKNLHSQMRHSNLINIRETKRKSQHIVRPLLMHASKFVSDISGRFLHAL